MQIRKLKKAFMYVIFLCLLTGTFIRNPYPTFATASSDNFANVVLFVNFKDTDHSAHIASATGECFLTNADTTFRLFNGDAEHPRGMKQYLYNISYGQLRVANIFPQYKDGTITPYELEGNAADYAGDLDTKLIQETLNKLVSSGQLSSSTDIDLNKDGLVDNLTIVVPCESGNSNSLFYGHKSHYAGSEGINGKAVSYYNVLPESSVYFSLGHEGVIIHEFLHSQNYPDLYHGGTDSDSRTPVGIWDIMAQTSTYVSYPLAYLRSTYSGWFHMDTITTSQTGYSLYSASAATNTTKDQQAIILKTDYSDSEFFIVEYRQKGTDAAKSYDYAIPGSGLIIYRVNTAYETNYNGPPDMIYIFSPEVDYRTAFLSAESKRTSYGSSDPGKGLEDGAITYSDGTNSGIVISNVGSASGDRITFDITIPSDTATDYWSTVSTQGISDTSKMIESYMDSDGTIYYLQKKSDYSIYLYKYNDSGWSKVTTAALPVSSSAYDFGVVKYAGNLYAGCANGGYASLYQLKGSTWTKVYTSSTPVNALDITSSSEGIYLAYTDQASNKNLYVYQYTNSGGTMIGNPASVGNYVANPSIDAADGNLAVMYRDFGNNNQLKVLKYNHSSKAWTGVGNTILPGNGGMIRIHNGTVYLLKNGNGSISDNSAYMYACSLSGGDWTRIGANTFANESIVEMDICFNEDAPHILYQGGSTGIVHAMNLENNTWTQLGNRVAGEVVSGLRGYSYNGKIYVTYLNSIDQSVYIKAHISDNTGGVNVPSGTTTIYNGIDYSAVYDYNYYITQYPDVKNAFNGDPAKTLAHFVNHGMKEGRQAIATFNVTSYAYRYYDLRKAYKNDLAKYYLHYINNGKKEGRIATGTTTMQSGLTTYGGIDYSAVYNVGYYANKYTDLKKIYGFDDELYLKHFVNHGMQEGRQAASTFNVTSYAYRYYDLRKAYKNDLKKYYLHYINNGKKEGRIATGTTTMQSGLTTYGGVDYSAVYNVGYYANKYADLRKTYGFDDEAYLKHFINYGMQEGRQGNTEFIVSYYRSNYVDLERTYGATLKPYYLHYINHGKKEGRIANKRK